MDQDQPSYDQLIASIYRAGSGRGSWDDVLTQVALHLDLWAAQALGVDKKTGCLLFSHEGGVAPPQATLDYLRTYHALNPRVAPVLALPLGQWMHCHEHFDDEYVARSSFYQEFLIPHGGRFLSGTKILEDEENLILLGAMRGNGKKPLDADDLAFLDRVKFHIENAMQNYLKTGAAASAMAAAHKLLEQFGYPMFLVDEHRRIRFMNRKGEQALKTSEYLVDRSGSLGCRLPASDFGMLQAIRELKLPASAENAPLPSRRFARLAAADGRAVGLYAVAIRPEASLGVYGQLPLALLILYDPKQQCELDPLIVGEMFDLSPAESKIAVLLATGASPTEVAARNHTSLDTVRVQIRSIFAKTSVSRQADLVALLRGMPVMWQSGMHERTSLGPTSAKNVPLLRDNVRE